MTAHGSRCTMTAPKMATKEAEAVPISTKCSGGEIMMCSCGYQVPFQQFFCRSLDLSLSFTKYRDPNIYSSVYFLLVLIVIVRTVALLIEF